MRVVSQGSLRHLAVAACLLLLAVPAEGSDRLPAGVDGDTIVVLGKVVDRHTGRDIPGVRVELQSVDPEPGGVWEGTTTESGRFQTSDLPAGHYRIRVQALGFADVDQEILLSGAARMDLRIELVPEALELDPIVVATRRTTRLEASGFFERRRLGIGHTLTREEIEARNPHSVSALLRTIPGVEVVSVRGGIAGGTVRLRRGCEPELVVNGVRVRNPGPIENIVSIGDLEAIEVYHGAAGPMTPINTTCGTVVAWTKEGGPQEGARPLSLRPIVAAAAIFFLSSLFVR